MKSQQNNSTKIAYDIRKQIVKKKRGNVSYEDIIKRVSTFSNKDIIPEEKPPEDFEPTCTPSFVSAYNEINCLLNEDLAELFSGFTIDCSASHRLAKIRTMHVWLVKIATHNKSVTDYFEQVCKCAKFPKKTDNLEYWTLLYGEDYAKEKMNRKSERVLGTKNPAYQHGGKLSPFSKNFVKGYVGVETAKKAAASREKNNTDRTKLSFWTERYGEEEGKLRYYDRQNTFSLEKCIKKYGEDEGRKIFQRRQEKWLESLENLSEQEKILIRAKKGFWRHTDPKTDEMDINEDFNNKITKLYVIEYQPVPDGEVYIKIGVTSKYLSQRFPTITIKRVIAEYKANRFVNFHRERDIKKFIFENNLSILIESEQDKFSGWTECVSIEHKEKLLGVVDEAVRNNPA
jgi:hypothetical protein